MRLPVTCICLSQIVCPCRQRETVLPEQRWQVEAAVLKLLTRRCTCLEFHPTRDNIVLAGDKKGMVAVWDFEKVGVPGSSR